MNRQLLINRLKAHIAVTFEDAFDDVVLCRCGWIAKGGEAEQWARHVASVIYPETAGADKTVSPS